MTELFAGRNGIGERLKADCPRTHLVELFEKIRAGQKAGILRPGLIPELVYLAVLGYSMFCSGVMGTWEMFCDQKLDLQELQRQLLFLFCTGVEGPECPYDWRGIHFPSGIPAAGP
jgi:hypothetical protein